ncbi:hypothetical protein HGO38_12475 [Rhizobium sp. CG5]|uniref:hypothetical protein n=1 Tax=Rhizobium sp. CG5 TaxID=2726076 RepID=UPI002034877B|nr:hypothetical protein [Rhizobium sp. CG5]MCM2474289.1 hypothetical protein [Rhizobium sp. CG5]
MPRSRVSTQAFHNKISTFCEQRLAPALPPNDYENLRCYMLGLIARKASPPRQGDKLDWPKIAADCDLHGESLYIARKLAPHGFDAVLRWLGEGRPSAMTLAGNGARPVTSRPPMKMHGASMR